MRSEFRAGPDDHDRRLETILRRLLPHQSLGALHKALRTGDIRLNGAKATSDTRVSDGDTLTVWDKLVAPQQPPQVSPSIPGGPPPGWVLYQDDNLLVVNKPSGLVVHRGEGRTQGRPLPLDEQVRGWLAPTQRPTLGFRPGPLHRLDRETSGLVVFSASLVGARTFSQAMVERKVEKRYLAVVSGILNGPRDVTARLSRDDQSKTTLGDQEGEEATSRFLPLATADGLTLVEVLLGTGRTHQIRAHAQILGHPLVGDRKYGAPASPPGLPVPWMLHAWKLRCSLLPDLKAPLSEETSLWLRKTFKISL